MTNHLESELARLPEPEPAATFAGSVMARVSRLAEERASTPLAPPASMKIFREERVTNWNDLPAWVTTLAGLAIVFVSWVDGRITIGSVLGFMSPHVGVPHLATMPSSESAALGLALGSLIYLAGLFAPLRRRR